MDGWEGKRLLLCLIGFSNRLNKIEWLLLGNYKWGNELSTRQNRLRALTKIGHEYSLMVGADCPIGNIQQHAWSMVDTRLPLPQQLLQIRCFSYSCSYPVITLSAELASIGFSKQILVQLLFSISFISETNQLSHL